MGRAGGRAADDVRAAIEEAGGAIPFSRVRRARAVRAARLLHRGDERRLGRASWRLPDVTRGRSAVRGRGRPRPRRRVGSARPARSVHRRRRRRRARDARPGRAGRRARAARRRCATSPSRSSDAQRARHPGRGRVPARPAGRSDRRRRAGQRAARQPAVPARRPRRGVARGVRASTRPDGTFAEVLSAPFDPVPAVLPDSSRPTAPGRRCRTPPRSWLTTARALVRRGSVVVVDYARPSTAEMARAAVAVVAADVPGSRARRPSPASTPASRTSPSTSPSTSSPEPDRRAARRRSSCSATASTSSSTEGRRAWAAAAARPDLAALAMRSRVAEAEALLDPAGLGGFTVLEWRVSGASPGASERSGPDAGLA